MAPHTREQIPKFYSSVGRLRKTTYQFLHEHYGVPKRPSENATCNLVHKLVQSWFVIKLKAPLHSHRGYWNDNILIMHDSVDLSSLANIKPYVHANFNCGFTFL